MGRIPFSHEVFISMSNADTKGSPACINNSGKKLSGPGDDAFFNLNYCTF
jgi:hypothetical protein